MTPLAAKKIPRLLIPFSRFAIRFHLSLILIGTLASGWVFGRLLLVANITYMPLRYMFSTLCAYGVFILLSSLWLKYLGRNSNLHEPRRRDTDADFPDDLPDIPEPLSETKRTLEAITGEGGDFSGAGASGNFDGSGLADWSVDGAVATPEISDMPDVVPDADDLFGAVIAAIIFIIAFVFFMWGAYLLMEIPFLFIEGVFHGILTGALVKATKRLDDEEWATSVFKQTRWIAAAVLAATLATGFYVESKCPTAQKLSDGFSCKAG